MECIYHILAFEGNKSKPDARSANKTPISGKETDIRELECQTRQTLEQAVKIQGVLAVYRYMG